VKSLRFGKLKREGNERPPSPEGIRGRQLASQVNFKRMVFEAFFINIPCFGGSTNNRKWHTRAAVPN
jgi:hypothetical protein